MDCRASPAGVLTGGVLLVAGMVADGWGWVLAFVLGMVGIELITLVLWAGVAPLRRLRNWVLRRQR